MVESLVALERDLYLLLNSPHTPYLDGVMYIISEKWVWALYLIFFIAALSGRQRPREVILVLVTMILMIVASDQISSGLFKPYFQRARPSYHELTADVVRLVLDDRGGGYGFISGHTLNFMTFVTFTALLFRDRWYTIIGYIVAGTVMYSRIYLGMHFITDIIPSIIIGGLLAWATYALYVRCRIAWLQVPPSQAHTCYVQPDRQLRLFAPSLTIMYLFFWTIAPVIFHYCYLH